MWAFIRFIFRFALGFPLDGVRRSDAGFMTRGRAGLDGRTATGWELLPYGQRGTIRLGLIVITVAEVWAYVLHHGAWWAVNLTCASVCALVGIRVGWRTARDGQLDRWVRVPIRDGVVRLLQLPTDTAPRRVVTVPAGTIGGLPAHPFIAGAAAAAGPLWAVLRRRVLEGRPWFERAADGHLARLEGRRDRAALARPIVVHLPSHFRTPDANLAKIVTTCLGSPDAESGWSVAWQLRGPNPQLLVRPEEHPPAAASWGDYALALDLCGPTELLIGPTTGHRPVRINIDQDSPHIAASMGSGAGKSVLLKLMIAQGLRKGWAVVLIDLKQESHPWLKELIDREIPGVYYARKPDQAHAILLALEEERDRRADIRWGQAGAQFQRVLIVVEEANMTAEMLREYWRTIKPKGAPEKSPALRAMGNLSYAGRSLQMHLVMVGQSLSAQVFGGPEARESFAVRILGRYTANNWKMLVPEIPFRRSSRLRGRVQVCIAGDATAVQVLYLDDTDAIEYAAGGIDAGNPPGLAPLRLDVPGVPTSMPAGLPALDQQTTRGQLPAGTGRGTADWTEPGAAPRYTLREALDAGMVSGSWEAVKKARTRDGNFPTTDDGKLTEEEWRTWQTNRIRTVA